MKDQDCNLVVHTELVLLLRTLKGSYSGSQCLSQVKASASAVIPPGPELSLLQKGPSQVTVHYNTVMHCTLGLSLKTVLAAIGSEYSH